ncbi:MAG: helix-turn-helix domain-containing protein [Treponemataceae bacterium]|nr:helix-turn-helix domain-containing protein [Treponemataceae bacterium]
MNASDIQKRLGENIKTIRKSKKLTQFQLAEKADVSEETIKNIELNRCWISEKTLSQITDALDVDVSELFMPVASSFKTDKSRQKQLKTAISQSIKDYVNEVLKEFE